MQICRTSLSRQNLASERHEVLAVRERDRERARASARSSSSQSPASLCGQRYPARWRLRRRGPASAPTCGLGEAPAVARRAAPAEPADQSRSHGMHRCTARPSSSPPQCPARGRRVKGALRASPRAIGVRRPWTRHTHSHRIGACEDDGQEQDWLEPRLRGPGLQGWWHRCRDGPAVTFFLGRGRVSPGWQADAPLVYPVAGTRPSFGSNDY